MAARIDPEIGLGGTRHGRPKPRFALRDDETRHGTTHPARRIARPSPEDTFARFNDCITEAGPIR